jgi:hypothetical protein
MELDPIGVRPPAKCLVGIGHRTREQGGSAWEIEAVCVPLEHIEPGGRVPEYGVASAGVREEDGMDPDFWSGALVYACAQACCEQLSAKANAPIRDPTHDRLADVLTLIS